MAFRASIKVRFSDIDNAGIVYYPRFAHYFHLAMEEFFGAVLKIDYADALHKKKVSLPTVHLETDFRSRLKYGDTIDIEVKVVKIGSSSITWGYKGFNRRNEKVVVEGDTTTVCVNTATFKKLEVPKWLKQGILKYMERCKD
jgi:4-hydroxybenzoyl-CoA thioesterase